MPSVLIPRISYRRGAIGDKFKRTQILIRLAFAMTINKAQGQTFDQVGLYLPTPVFTHGLLYVAMFRVRTPASIKILIDPKIAKVGNHAGTFTSNIVYPEALLRNT